MLCNYSIENFLDCKRLKNKPHKKENTTELEIELPRKNCGVCGEKAVGKIK